MKKKLFLFLLVPIFLLVSMNLILASEVQDMSLRLNRIELLDGDVNVDHHVGIIDLASVGYSFGAKDGDNNWDWKVDIAGTNEQIDISDLAEIGLNYGKDYLSLINDPVFISPPEKNITRNQIFSIYINISTPSNVYAFDFTLRFNSSLLEAMNITEGDFLSKDGRSVFSVIRINSTLGEINFASTRIGTNLDVTGEGTLAKLTFKALNKYLI